MFMFDVYELVGNKIKKTISTLLTTSRAKAFALDGPVEERG